MFKLGVGECVFFTVTDFVIGPVAVFNLVLKPVLLLLTKQFIKQSLVSLHWKIWLGLHSVYM